MRDAFTYGPHEFSAKIHGPASTSNQRPLNFRRKFVAAQGVAHG